MRSKAACANSADGAAVSRNRPAPRQLQAIQDDGRADDENGQADRSARQAQPTRAPQAQAADNEPSGGEAVGRETQRVEKPIADVIGSGPPAVAAGKGEAVGVGPN